MKPSEFERLPLRMEQLYREIGELMMEDVVRRIRKTGKITSTADYQIQRLTLLGATSEEIEKEIQKRLKLSYSELWKLYDEVVDWEYVRNKDVYEQINSDFIPWQENYQLQQITHGIMKNALADLKNITRSMGFATRTDSGLKFTPMAEYYQKHLDQTLLSIVTGTFDYNTALRKCVTQMTNSGIRTVDYASGHSNRIDVAARRAVMTGLSQVTGRITDYHAARLGIDTYEVAWHAGARNTGSRYLNHQSWQGKVYTKQQLIDICGLGQGGGLCGWNCYHEYYMFFPGSKRNWSDDWLENRNKAENTPKEYNGKLYDVYQATQKQRQMETSMRAQRQKVKLLQAGDADADTIMNERIKYNDQLYEYAKFSNKMGLKQQRERIHLDMYGRIGLNKASYQKYKKEIEIKKKTDIIKAEIKKLGIKGELSLQPAKLDLSGFSFDDKHINSDREHGIKRSEALCLIREADVTLTRWNGRFVNYYGPNGAVYVDMETGNIRTAFRKDEFDDKLIKLREVLKKNGVSKD